MHDEKTYKMGYDHGFSAGGSLACLIMFMIGLVYVALR